MATSLFAFSWLLVAVFTFCHCFLSIPVAEHGKVLPKPSVPITLVTCLKRGGGVQSVPFLSLESQYDVHALCHLPFKNSFVVKLGNPFLWILLCICSKNRDEVVYFCKYISRSEKAICLTLLVGFFNALTFQEQEQGSSCLLLLQ